jgi:hypothetical protein
LPIYVSINPFGTAAAAILDVILVFGINTIEKPSGTLAVVASLIAAVKLAKVESQELQNRSPRVRSAIADAVTLARMVVDAARK